MKFKSVSKKIDKDRVSETVEYLKSISPDVFLTDKEEVEAVNAALELLVDFLLSIVEE